MPGLGTLGSSVVLWTLRGRGEGATGPSRPYSQGLGGQERLSPRARVAAAGWAWPGRERGSGRLGSGPESLRADLGQDTVLVLPALSFQPPTGPGEDVRGSVAAEAPRSPGPAFDP